MELEEYMGFGKSRLVLYGLLIVAFMFIPMVPQPTSQQTQLAPTQTNQTVFSRLPVRLPFWDSWTAIHDLLISITQNGHEQQNFSWSLTSSQFFNPPIQEAHASITRVQGNARGTNSGSTITVTMSTTPTSGNLLVATVTVTAGNACITVTSISETNVVWTAQKASCSGVFMDSEIWVGVVSGSASSTVTVNLNGTPQYAGIANISEYSGLVTSSFLDKSASNSGSTSTSDTGTTAATTQASELWIGSIADIDTFSVNAAQSSPTNGFTLLDGADFAGGSGTHLSNGYLEKIVSSTGAANSGTTLAGTGFRWTGVIATFKASVASASLSDSQKLTDSVGRLQSVGKPLTDQSAFSDALHVVLGRQLLEVLNVADSIVSKQNLVARILSDTLSIMETLGYSYHSTVTHNYPPPLVDSQQLVDLLTKQYVGHVTLSDVNLLADSIIRLRNVPVILSEVFNLAESLTRLGPPAVPASFTATTSGGNPGSAIDVSWASNPSDNPATTSYVLQHSVDQSTWTSICGTCTTTTFTDSGLQPGFSYYYRVRAFNGQYSAYSGTVSAYTLSSNTLGGTTPPTTYLLVVLLKDLAGTPIQGASVSQGSASLLTTSTGTADFGSLNAGTYTIQVSASGCTGTSQQISLQSNHGADNPLTVSIACGAQQTGTTNLSAIESFLLPILGIALAAIAVTAYFQTRKQKRKREAR